MMQSKCESWDQFWRCISSYTMEGVMAGFNIVAIMNCSRPNQEHSWLGSYVTRADALRRMPKKEVERTCLLEGFCSNVLFKLCCAAPSKCAKKN